jgi:hypothetical protein
MDPARRAVLLSMLFIRNGWQELEIEAFPGADLGFPPGPAMEARKSFGPGGYGLSNIRMSILIMT